MSQNWALDSSDGVVFTWESKLDARSKGLESGPHFNLDVMLYDRRVLAKRRQSSSRSCLLAGLDKQRGDFSRSLLQLSELDKVVSFELQIGPQTENVCSFCFLRVLFLLVSRRCRRTYIGRLTCTGVASRVGRSGFEQATEALGVASTALDHVTLM